MRSCNTLYKLLPVWLAMAGLGLFLAGCASTPPPAAPAADAKVGTTLRVGELLTITFSDTASPVQPFEGRIREDGKITLMYNQEFTAAGRTTTELEKEIHDRYVPSLFVNLTVTVKAMDRFFYVEGEVKQPNRFEYRGDITVLGAISAANGFTEFAKSKNVTILRGDKTIKVNCDKAKTNPKYDVPIYPGDRIIVPKKFW